MARSRKLNRSLACTEDGDFYLLISLVLFLTPCVVLLTVTNLLLNYIKSKMMKACLMIFSVLGNMIKDQHLK